MEEIGGAAVLVTHSSAASSSSPAPSAPGSQTPHGPEEDASPSFQRKQADNSLIQVIQKLSKIVEKRPQRRFASGGQKRVLQPASSAGGDGGEEASRGSRQGSPHKKMKRSATGEAVADADALPSPVSGDSNNNSIASAVTEVDGNPDGGDHKRTVTCYQCSLCPYLSQTLSLLKEHLKQHNEQHSDLILMCSECHFTSRDQRQLEAHVRLHFDNRGDRTRASAHLDTFSEGKGEVLRKQGEDWTGDRCGTGPETIKSSEELPQKKKWYSYEEYGLYRCLICSYVCSQQRMLKTHAWKHAGLVDCSYPIFEDEDEGSARREAQTVAGNAATREELVVLSPVLQEKSLQKLPAAFKLQLCMPAAVENKQDAANLPVSRLKESPKTEEEEGENAYPVKDLTSEEPAVEVQVTSEAEAEIDGRHDGDSVTDSLLSSAQKIINSGPNSAGHINVIVERLPSAEDSVMASNPLLLGPDVDRDESLLDAKKEEPEEVVISGGPGNTTDSRPPGADVKPSVTKSSDSPRDENIPPAGRKRTHSESLRLHSLAAEALVAMPMRTPELPGGSSAKFSLKTVTTQAQSPHVGQKLFEVTTAGQRASDGGTAAALLDLELHGDGGEEHLGPLGLGEEDEEGPAAKAGISLSLLTVIERLRERSDQNASDEDILKELQDNAQFQHGAIAGVVTGSGAGGYVCGIPGTDGAAGSADGGLVDYIAGSDRPYRCRLCRYSSGNKGYIKQHLRVHRQREPYQCPICEHIASDSQDLENHMINHCKTRMYQCKQCPDAFHYKSQLRSHEREHHRSSGDASAALTAVTETAATTEEPERPPDEDCGTQKTYKCDVCNYTSSTYVGVRNHRRIHNSDKPYRCCSCDFATTNMNSLKSHMKKHPQEHQAVQLLEQYRCSLCGYVCSHPPSLKSHMWKHAGDQNYNYEQVNKAINEAISQSSRAPQKLSAVLESAAERPAGRASGGRASGGGPALQGQSPGPGGASADSRVGCKSRSARRHLGGPPHASQRRCTVARRRPEPPGQGPRPPPASAPEPGALGPDPRPGPRHGVLRAPVLLLHLRLRVHQ
ncbi:zinc finger protein 507 isoform X2 [Embiotoca jacksoni]